jgi:chromosome segregation ATPase
MKKTFNYQSDANFYDKKDFIIATLKRKINSFKEYDAERKKHYAGLEQKIGELESYIDELENGSTIASLNNKIQSLENEIEKQNLKIRELRAKVNISLFDNTKSFRELESIANNLKDFNSMKLAIKALKKHLKDNKKTISDLVYELTQAKLKIKQLTGE